VVPAHSSQAPIGRDARYFRALIEEHRTELDEVLRRYGATNPRLFGSVARGDATEASDIDVLIDLDERPGNELLRVAGVAEEFRRVLGVEVDVISPRLLRDAVAASARRDMVSL
jgi:predicted nucleotidyltransferase